MKMTLVPQQYFDGTGKPLIGRLHVFDRSTDIPGTESDGVRTKLYTFADGAYSDAANPQILDSDGRLPGSVYFDAAVVTVRLERYNGNSSMGSDDDPSHWELVDSYDAGMEWDDSTPTAFADSIDALKAASTVSSPILVTGYYRNGDSPARVYVWDPDCVQASDGGYIVKSDSSDSGRWIMLWGEDSVPCTLYGVFPGKLENLNALFNYGKSAGTAGIATAPKIRFVPGDYETGALDYVTGKNLAFDAGARFVGTGTMKCPRAEVAAGGKSYVADFLFSEADATARSSWFRTMDGFFGCGAGKLVVDASNHFEAGAGRRVSKTFTLKNVEIEARSVLSETYGAGMYSAGTCLTLDACAIVGTPFGPNDRLLFKNSTFERAWFPTSMKLSEFSFGKISEGRKIQCLTADGNVLDLDRFVSADVFAKAVVADGQTELILGGESLAGLPAEIVKASGGKIASIERSGGTLTLRDVDVESVDFDGIQLIAEHCAFKAGNIVKSAISARNCSFECSIGNQSETEGFGGAYPISAASCFFEADVSGESVALDGCRCAGKISIRPYLADGKTVYACNFSGCEFLGDGTLEFLPPQHSDSSGLWVQVDAANVYITDCRFNGSSTDGITMPRFVYRGNEIGTGAVKLFKNDAELVCTYRGNLGNCPLETPSGKLNLPDAYIREGVEFKGTSLRMFSLGAQPSFLTTTLPNPFVVVEVSGSANATLAGDTSNATMKIELVEPENVAMENDQFLARLLVLAEDGKAYYAQKIY